MGVFALVFGIAAIVLSFFFRYAWIGAILGVIGIVLGAVGRKNANKKGVATAGMVLSIIGTVLCLILYIACFACAAGVAGAL